MSPGFAGLSHSQSGAEGLEFVDDLKRDISSFLGTPEAGEEDNLLDCLQGSLCYMCPEDCSEDRWREARASSNDGVVQPSALAPSEAEARIFGAPPLSSKIRWPHRPQEHASDRWRSLLHGCGSPGGGGGSSGSDSGGGGSDSEKDAARARLRARRPSLPSQRGYAGDGMNGGMRGDFRSQRRELSEGGGFGTYGENMRRGRRNTRSRPDLRRGVCASPDLRGGGSSSSSTEGRQPQVNMDDLLRFTSCFESSNLQYAVYNTEDAAYDLVVENDVHTRGHTQWFYFAVRNGRLGETVRFRIVNMSKAKSLFNLGMKPLFWSEAGAAEHSNLRGCSSSSSSFPLDAGPATEMWRRCPGNVRYYPSKVGNGGKHHTLDFEYTFEFPGDSVFFAYCVPFTYSMLRTTLSAVAADPVASSRSRIRCLCNTTGNVRCDLVEISNFAISRRAKKAVVVSSRVHPGESNASWLVQGLMNFLLSDSVEAQVLRDYFVWQIVPMLNPDGVICGNYRCGLTGVDLNRQWRRPNQDLHSTIYKVKKLIAYLKKKARLCLYLDLHGHSRKCGIFSYACGNYPKDDYRRYAVRMFPKLVSMLTPEFEYSSCKWRVGKGKRGTGRVVVSKDVGLVNTYTIEASFYGAVMREQPQEAEHKDKGAGSDSEGSDHEGASPTAVVRDAIDQEAARQVAPVQMVIFTPTKLEEFGTNLARALILQQNLGPIVQLAMKRRLQKEMEQKRQSEDSSEDCAKLLPSSEPSVPAAASDSENTTPSAGSDGNLSDSEDDACRAASKAAEPGLDAFEPPTQAEEAERPYLGIDVAEVMHDLEVLPDDSEEAETASGSDSDPSEDNLIPEDLVRLVRMLSRKRKSASAPPPSTTHSTSGPSGGSKSGNGSGNHTNQASTSSLPRAKTDLCTPPRKSPTKRKSRTGESKGRRSERRAAAAMAQTMRLEPRPTALARVVAFGQTTYVVPPGRCGPSASAASHSPVSPPSSTSPGCVRSPSDTQRGFCAGWSQPPWPAIPTALGRPVLGRDVSQLNAIGSAHSEAFVLLGTPPKDRFAFPQGGVGDIRRAQAPGSMGRLTLGHGDFGRLSEETRSRVCVRNASSTMLQFHRTYASAPLQASQASQLASASDAFGGVAGAMPAQGSSPTGPDRASVRAHSCSRSLSRPGSACARSTLRVATPLFVGAEGESVVAALSRIAAIDGAGAEACVMDVGAFEDGTTSSRANTQIVPFGRTPRLCASMPPTVRRL